MTNIAFYHLTTSPLESALPRLVEKAYASGQRALVVAESQDRVERLNQALWTYHPASFLPHGSLKEPQAERQPVLLDTEFTAVNQATLLFITDGRQIEDESRFSRVFDMFDGRDEAVVSQARLRWRAYKDAGYALTYWKQTAQGGWEKAA